MLLLLLAPCRLLPVLQRPGLAIGLLLAILLAAQLLLAVLRPAGLPSKLLSRGLGVAPTCRARPQRQWGMQS